MIVVFSSMADETDLERAVNEMLSDLSKRDMSQTFNNADELLEFLNREQEDDVEYWQSEYWNLKDEYDQMVSKLEELVRNYCG